MSGARVVITLVVITLVSAPLVAAVLGSFVSMRTEGIHTIKIDSLLRMCARVGGDTRTHILRVIHGHTGHGSATRRIQWDVASVPLASTHRIQWDVASVPLASTHHVAHLVRQVHPQPIHPALP